MTKLLGSEAGRHEVGQEVRDMGRLFLLDPYVPHAGVLHALPRRFEIGGRLRSSETCVASGRAHQAIGAQSCLHFAAEDASARIARPFVLVRWVAGGVWLCGARCGSCLDFALPLFSFARLRRFADRSPLCPAALGARLVGIVDKVLPKLSLFCRALPGAWLLH